jgi:hypothetical protein
MAAVTFYEYSLMSRVLDHCEARGRRHIRFRELAADVLGTYTHAHPHPPPGRSRQTETNQPNQPPPPPTCWALHRPRPATTKWGMRARQRHQCCAPAPAPAPPTLWCARHAGHGHGAPQCPAGTAATSVAVLVSPGPPVRPASYYHLIVADGVLASLRRWPLIELRFVLL